EVITGEQEAALSFFGATRGLDPLDGPFLVVDIGGGSTEFVFGRAPAIADHAISVRMGSVRLTERSIRSDPPAPEDLDRLREEVRRGIEEAAAALPAGEARTFVSVAGTATTIKAIALGLGRYDPEVIHRTWLTAAEAERVLGELIGMTNEARAAIPGMAPGRGGVIGAGSERAPDEDRDGHRTSVPGEAGRVRRQASGGRRHAEAAVRPCARGEGRPAREHDLHGRDANLVRHHPDPTGYHRCAADLGELRLPHGQGLFRWAVLPPGGRLDRRDPDR